MRRPSALLVPLLALGAALAVHAASGQSPPAPGPGSAPASGSPEPASASAGGSPGVASASASGSVAVPAPAPTAFTKLVVPEGVSPRPKLTEWKEVTPFYEETSGARCKARFLREWLLVECLPPALSAITLYSGPVKEYTATAGAGDSHSPYRAPSQILFPLRRGLRYQVGISFAMLEDYQSGEVSGETLLVLSAYWLEDESSPTLVFSNP